MIVHRVWYGRRVKGSGGKRNRFEGWFLLGIIPIVVRQLTYYDPN
jgi:hypothetical protein